MLRKIQGIYAAPRPHWVGDGFPVRSLFSYGDHGKALSPFLLLDHAGPHTFAPTTARHGVGTHPHRGFETVTIVYEGEVEHRDSTGAGGIIGPGDVQWMTAASGILHEEFHSEAFARRGGPLEMVQLWVNLPAENKMSPPGYQTILRSDIPTVSLPDGAGHVRVIAGEFKGHPGPARTFTPMNVWDAQLAQNGVLRFDTIPSHSLALVVLRGTVLINENEIVREGQLVQFERDDVGLENIGTQLEIEANNDSVLLVLSGEPILEPVVGHGPFVMNSKAEILEAFEDFNNGSFGSMKY